MWKTVKKVLEKVFILLQFINRTTTVKKNRNTKPD
jgi:hypothetical protein